MSVYENKVVYLNCPPAPAPAVPNPIYGISYKLKERDIYGSSRIGIDEHQKEMLGAIFNPLIYERIVGDKQFEISNHLGNVLTVITDRKMPVDIGNDNNVDYFIPDIASANDYYAFGSQMPGRNFSSANYRYGFNGKENDNEVKGSGNQQDYGMRIYDPRLGKFLSVDPITNEYPELTPYQFASNRPIDGIDIDGLEWGMLGTLGRTTKLTMETAGWEVGLEIGMQWVKPIPFPVMPFPPITLPVPGGEPILIPQRGLSNAKDATNLAKPRIVDQFGRTTKNAKDEEYDPEAAAKEYEDFKKVLEGWTKGGTSTKKNTKGEDKEIGQQEEEITKAQQLARKEGKGSKIESVEKSKQNRKKATEEVKNERRNTEKTDKEK